MSRIPQRRKEIRTISKVVGRGKRMERHVHQFQIACLELERTRRLKELALATNRVTEINLRLDEIEREMMAHAGAMTPLPDKTPSNKREASLPNSAPTPSAQRQNSNKNVPQTEGKRRTLRY